MSEVVDVETGEVVPYEEVPLQYAPALALTPESAKEMVEQVREIQRGVMREGVDYMQIKGTPKPSLLKPGAETLQRVFGFGVEFDRTVYDRDGKDFFVAYKCRVTRAMPTGQIVVVSECEGAAGNDEAKWRKAPANTIMKMAQKRAYVGAILLASGASDLFTQDLEDMDRSSQRAPAPVEEAFDASTPFDPAEFRFEKGKQAGKSPVEVALTSEGREWLRWLSYEWKPSGSGVAKQRWVQSGVRAFYDSLKPADAVETVKETFDAEEIEFPAPTTPANN